MNGVARHVIEAGEVGAPVLALRHGFPELWWAWRHPITPLAAAGLALCDDGRLVIVEGAIHRAPIEHHLRVNRELLPLLGPPEAASTT